MGSSKGASKKAGKAAKAVKVARLPKKKCCVASKKCGRCPLRMLKEGTLPPGYTVKKRRLVKVEVVTGTPRGTGKPSRKAGREAA